MDDLDFDDRQGLARGILPERDEEDDRKGRLGADQAAIEQVRAVLADLDRKWQIPPVVFCRELAVQMVGAMRDDPELMEALAKAVARAVLDLLAAR